MAPIVAALGHAVIARVVEVDDVGERHSIDDGSAFDMLRGRSRTANRKLVDIAAAVVDGHALLPKEAPQPPA